MLYYTYNKRQRMIRCNSSSNYLYNGTMVYIEDYYINSSIITFTIALYF